jgi:preprotein translocase subunit SecE
MFKKISKFILDVRQEMTKVSWPSWEELKGTTGIVIVITVILSVFIWGVDKILEIFLKVIF